MYFIEKFNFFYIHNALNSNNGNLLKNALINLNHDLLDLLFIFLEHGEPVKLLDAPDIICMNRVKNGIEAYLRRIDAFKPGFIDLNCIVDGHDLVSYASGVDVDLLKYLVEEKGMPLVRPGVINPIKCALDTAYPETIFPNIKYMLQREPKLITSKGIKKQPFKPLIYIMQMKSTVKHSDVFKLLLEAQCKLSGSSQDPLRLSVEDTQELLTKIVKNFVISPYIEELLDYVDIRTLCVELNGEPPLIVSFIKNLFVNVPIFITLCKKFEQFRQLIAKARLNNGDTCLHILLRHNPNCSSISHLIDICGACTENDLKEQPINVCNFTGPSKCVDLLISKGADINHLSHAGESCVSRHVSVSHFITSYILHIDLNVRYHHKNKNIFHLLMEADKVDPVAFGFILEKPNAWVLLIEEDDDGVTPLSKLLQDDALFRYKKNLAFYKRFSETDHSHQFGPAYVDLRNLILLNLNITGNNYEPYTFIRNLRNCISCSQYIHVLEPKLINFMQNMDPQELYLALFMFPKNRPLVFSPETHCNIFQLVCINGHRELFKHILLMVKQKDERLNPVFLQEPVSGKSVTHLIPLVKDDFIKRYIIESTTSAGGRNTSGLSLKHQNKSRSKHPEETRRTKPVEDEKCMIM
ncbi:hypothetical protein AKO1_013047 [Acrasis kona]|uniref:Uncharacterized protein n=1 Tax=Acrasis kona TaxID=1008807 RepID=A0AAW2Z1D2_9EUKA